MFKLEKNESFVNITKLRKTVKIKQKVDNETFQ